MSQVPRSHLIPTGGFRDTWPQDPQQGMNTGQQLGHGSPGEEDEILPNTRQQLETPLNKWLNHFSDKTLSGCLGMAPLPVTPLHPCQVALWHWLNFPLVYNCAGVIFSPSCLNKFPMCQYQCLYHGLIESAKRIADIFVAIETGHDVTQLVSFPFAIYPASFWTWSPFVSRGITLKYNSILVQSPFCSKEDYRILRYFLRKVQSDDNIAVWLMCIPDYSKNTSGVIYPRALDPSYPPFKYLHQPQINRHFLTEPQSGCTSNDCTRQQK